MMYAGQERRVVERDPNDPLVVLDNLRFQVYRQSQKTLASLSRDTTQIENVLRALKEKENGS